MSAVLDWLLDGDPAIRWQVMRDLLDAPAEEVAAERSQVASNGWGRALLDLQDSDGTWAGGLYGPKWTSTTYTLLVLRHCGLAAGTPAALAGVKRLWDGARYFHGGLTAAVTIDLPEACITAMYVSLARFFDYRDPRIDDAVGWLLASQLPDGGWNCETVRSGDRHGSFHTTIAVLEALAEEEDAPEVIMALDAGRDFFLEHRLYRSHRDGSVFDPAMTRLSFPPRWRYDVLRGLDHFAALRSPWDDRYHDAVDVVVGKRRKDGTWPVQQKHSGRVWFDMEPTGGPSRWNTLRALRVLRWAGSGSRPPRQVSRMWRDGSRR